MNVSLTPELEREVEVRVRNGLYASASGLVRDALRLLCRQDAERSRELELLDGRLREGLDSLDRGEGVPGPEARRRSKGGLAASRQTAPGRSLQRRWGAGPQPPAGTLIAALQPTSGTPAFCCRYNFDPCRAAANLHLSR
jgi:antitoxin ParD1/3/4